MKNTAAVIGANGFLGSALVNGLLQGNELVFAVHNGNTQNINPKSISITNESFLNSDLLPDEIYFAVGNYASTHEDLLAINNLLYSISKKFLASKIIYISSTNVYGMHKEIIYLQTPFNNPTQYAISKIAAEFIVTAHKKYAILRLTYLYGLGIKNKSFLPNLITTSKETGQITLFGPKVRRKRRCRASRSA